MHQNPEADARRNAQMRCEAKGCAKNRQKGTSIYCPSHRYRSEKYGSPHGSPVYLKELKPFLTDARGFLQVNAEHTGVMAALRLLHEYIYKWPYKSPLTRRAMDRLRQHQVKSGDVLADLIAIFHLNHFRDRFDRADAIRFAFGRAVVSAAPREPYVGANGKRRFKLPQTVVVREVGKWVQVYLGQFLVGVSKSIASTNERRADLRALASQPIQPVAAPPAATN